MKLSREVFIKPRRENFSGAVAKIFFANH